MKVLIVFALVFATNVLLAESRGRIIGGKDANPAYFKYQARVFVPSAYSYEEMATCGGSVIHNNWVLTAAHCFEHGNKKTTYVVLGLIEDNVFVNMSNAQNVFVHKEYYHGRFKVLNDIALIQIPYVKLDNYIQSIPLSHMESLDGQVVTVAGWGLTGPNSHSTKMQYATFNVLSANECYKKFGRNVPSTQLCTFAITKNVCVGDSGGPAVVGFGPNADQVGLASHTLTECSANSPAAYTRIFSYLPWIRSITKMKF